MAIALLVDLPVAKAEDHVVIVTVSAVVIVATAEAVAVVKEAAVVTAEAAAVQAVVEQVAAVQAEQLVAVVRMAAAQEPVDADNNIVLEYFNKYCNNVTTKKIKTQESA